MSKLLGFASSKGFIQPKKVLWSSEDGLNIGDASTIKVFNSLGLLNKHIRARVKIGQVTQDYVDFYLDGTRSFVKNFSEAQLYSAAYYDVRLTISYYNDTGDFKMGAAYTRSSSWYAADAFVYEVVEIIE